MIFTPQRVRNVLNSFIEKADNVNKPYKALQTTTEYKDLHSKLAAGIKAQAQWASENMAQILHVAHPGQPLNDLQRTRVSDYVISNLPPLSKYVSVDDLTQAFTFFFEWGAKGQYQRWGLRKANNAPKFKITNQKYLDALADQANYLLEIKAGETQAPLDETTREQIIGAIGNGKVSGLTNEELAIQIRDAFDQISIVRANMITRTEAAQAMGSGNFAVMKENNVTLIDWVTAGSNPCVICEQNEDASPIKTGDTFPSGDDHEPGHINCECYTQGEASSIDLENIDPWDGS